jgi:outer membrane protein OmpA-like peptidoglycan-associated protein
MRHLIATLALGIDTNRRTKVFIYGYSTSKDSSRGAAQLSLRRAVAVEDQLRKDLVLLGDVGVVLRASGEARLSNSVLASFRNVEVFAD